jgi:hypothetical protein
MILPENGVVNVTRSGSLAQFIPPLSSLAGLSCSAQAAELFIFKNFSSILSQPQTLSRAQTHKGSGILRLPFCISPTEQETRKPAYPSRPYSLFSKTQKLKRKNR